MSVTHESLQDYIKVMLEHPAAVEFRRLIRINVFDEWMRVDGEEAEELKHLLKYEEKFFALAATKQAAAVDFEK